MHPQTASHNPHDQYPIPDIPGIAIPQGHKQLIQDVIRNTIPGFNGRFPGSQPVSMTLRSLETLERKDFWVCEKTDGVRVLLLIVWNEAMGKQDVFLIDRKNEYRQIEGLFFPHLTYTQQAPSWAHTSLVDGELVLDRDRAGSYHLKYYVFDILAYHGENLMQQNLQSRYGRLKQYLLSPHKKFMQQNPQYLPLMPFELILKPVSLADGVEVVVKETIPKLSHGHDGLIFTCVDTPYVIGEDQHIIKWKPPSENSIDFKLSLRFPPSAEDPAYPDLTAKPLFLLNVFRGGRGGMESSYVFHDRMIVSDEEWERMKASGEQFDDRIIECCWDAEMDSWKFMRFRDDKNDGNFIDVVDRIIDSIKDGVELPQLIARCPTIRTGRKERAARAAEEAKRTGRRPDLPPAQSNAQASRVQAPSQPPQQGQFFPPRNMPKPGGYPVAAGYGGTGGAGGLRR